MYVYAYVYIYKNLSLRQECRSHHMYHQTPNYKARAIDPTSNSHILSMLR